jgi:predicted O-methyltransferase YrrM
MEAGNLARRTLNLTDELYDYLLSVTPPPSDVMMRLREETAKLPNSGMQISIEHGQFFVLLMKLTGAKRALEVGVFTGYSGLTVAQALPPDGQLIACDVSEEWTSIARRYWQEAGVANKIDLRIAPAAQTLKKMIDEGQAGTFDFAFIDADKSSYDTYYEAALQLVRRGGLIATDNTLWGGKVADASVTDGDTVALRALNQKMLLDDRVTFCLAPIGDGISLAVVK